MADDLSDITASLSESWESQCCACDWFLIPTSVCLIPLRCSVPQPCVEMSFHLIPNFIRTNNMIVQPRNEIFSQPRIQAISTHLRRSNGAGDGTATAFGGDSNVGRNLASQQMKNPPPPFHESQSLFRSIQDWHGFALTGLMTISPRFQVDGATAS